MAEKFVPKSKQFDDYLAKNGLNWFERIEVPEEEIQYRTVVYRGTLDAVGTQFQVIVVLDDSIYGLLRIVLTPSAIDEESIDSVLRYLNELNYTFKSFKYYLDQDNRIYLDVSFPSTAEEFNPELVVYMTVEVVLPHLKEYYPKLMQVAWSE
mgnify:CR=1 FL=1